MSTKTDATVKEENEPVGITGYQWDVEEAIHSHRDLMPDDDIVAIEELLMEGMKRFAK